MGTPKVTAPDHMFALSVGANIIIIPKKAITHLTILYNSMLRLSYYPLLWKFARILMVPTPGKPINDVTSYRPISLLPIPSKIFGKTPVEKAQK